MLTGSSASMSKSILETIVDQRKRDVEEAKESVSLESLKEQLHSRNSLHPPLLCSFFSG